MKTIVILLAIIGIIYFGYRLYRASTLSEGLEQKIAQGAIILDVRTPQEYEQGHIAGSINISLGTLRNRYIELDIQKTYITCCSHGLRSVKAESILKERGFKKVYNGGAWTDLNEIVLEQRHK